MCQKYCKKAYFPKCVPKDASSPGWKEICDARPVIRDNSQVLVGSGESVLVAYLDWGLVGGVALKEEKVVEVTKSKMRVTQILSGKARRWNRDLVEEMLRPEEASKLLRTIVRPWPLSDCRAWTASSVMVLSRSNRLTLCFVMIL